MAMHAQSESIRAKDRGGVRTSRGARGGVEPCLYCTHEQRDPGDRRARLDDSLLPLAHICLMWYEGRQGPAVLRAWSQPREVRGESLE